jgi:DMSO/TMAO reductase YedYZ heme-binding membrane subunit
MSTADLASPLGVSAMITFSVRLAVPWLFFAFAASSLFYVFPGTFSRWLIRNRRIMGLCFAAGMAWQLFFILILTTVHFDYYMAEENGIHSLVERVPGYLLIFAMTITSFQSARSKLSSRQWKLLHKTGIYFLWGVMFSAYWYELFYYDDIQFIDYAYFSLGFAAWGIRMLAWSKKRALRPAAT